MSIWEPGELDELIAAYKAALKAVAKNKSITVDGNTFTYQDQDAILEKLKFFTEEKKRESGAGGLRVMVGRPRR